MALQVPRENVALIFKQNISLASKTTCEWGFAVV